MKFTFSAAGSIVTSTLQAGAVLMLSQPAQERIMQEAALPADFDSQNSVSFNIAVMPSSCVQSGTQLATVVVPIEAEWDKAAKKRFKVLAVKEALGDISPDEQTELETLAALRRKKETTDDAGQILWEYKQRKLTNELMRLLEKYVEFHRPREDSSNRQET